VHPEILKNQKLPDSLLNDDAIWPNRYKSIVDFEQHMHRNGTKVIKFFLHLSKDEQRKRFIDRIDQPEKNWKFTIADINERQHWDDYMRAYESCLSATSTECSPWYVVPADDKKNARLIVSQVILDAYKDMDMKYPETSEERRQELLSIREQLIND
jgi:polyphosphate kinase 2 (PPK2 family)